MRLMRERGFTLIEIVVVMLVLAILIAMAAALTRGVMAGQKRSLTVTRIQTVDAALVQFVTQQKRLPCPADGTLVSTDANAGTEMRVANVCNPANQQNGVVPWRALGLGAADATDGWDRRLTYRVDPNLAANNGMDMSWCDPAGTEPGVGPTPCNTACASTALGSCTPPAKFLFTRGLEVRSVAGTVVMNPAPAAMTPHTGAAYVVISHGESGGGGYLSSGTLGASSAADGTEEDQRNYATRTYAGAATYYVDDSLNETATTAHFDDIVSRPSLLAVITKAGLGPRSH
jgi:prepilin-type N-terminal cleavage/methylation domain-containing protein